MHMTGSDYETFHPWNREMSQIGPGSNKVDDGLKLGKYGSGIEIKKNQYEILRGSASIKSKMGYGVHSCDEHMLIFIDDNAGDSAYRQLKDHVTNEHKGYAESGDDARFMGTVSEEKRREWA